MGRDLPPDVGVDSVVRPGRRHDLDALRAAAMLLGVVLHASLAYSSLPWPVTDVERSASGPFDLIFFVIHGFRMPLFFLLSGFFAWMLIEQRGVRGFVPHRLRRVVVPLLVGAVTILPLMERAIDWAARSDVPGRLLAAAYAGDAATVERLLVEGADPNGDPYGQPPSGAFGESPLHAAALMDHADVARLLIAAGADLNKGAMDAVEVMGWAVVGGSPQVAQLLVDGGIEDPRSPGTAWEELPGWGTRSAGVPSVGVLRPFTFHHLWFLWFLVVFTVGAVVARGVVAGLRRARVGWGAVHDRSERAPRALRGVAWGLIPLTIVPQLLMGDGGARRTFGPDASTGLVPAAHHLAYFAIFFAFGAFLSTPRRADGRRRIDGFSRHWVLLLLLAVMVTPAGLVTTFGGGDWAVASLLQVAFVWLVIPASIGLFRALFAEERRGVRFIADSSYWIYLIHLPLVIGLHAVLVTWEVSAALKFATVVLATVAFGLATYRSFVRYTPIGGVLNGPRRRPGRSRVVGVLGEVRPAGPAAPEGLP